MRIDAYAPGFVPPWHVYHAEECRMLREVVWVDDVACQWYAHDLPLRVVNGDVIGRVHHARKVDIHVDRKLIVVNPVEEKAPESIEAITTVPIEIST